MIIVDDRIGSRELIPLFRPFGVQVESTRLDSADFRFMGNGPDGDCMFGIERKRIGDLVQSMRSNRLSGHQLSGLFAEHQFVYLIVEGFYRPGGQGELEELRGRDWRTMSVGSRAVLYREVDNYLATLETKLPFDFGVPFSIRRTSTPYETVVQVVDLYRHWTDKTWKQHTSHLKLYAPAPDTLISKKVGFVSAEDQVRRKYGEDAVYVWKFAAQLPGLDTKAELVAKYFLTPDNMFMAGVREWMQIDGIGKTLAEKYTHIFRKR